MDATTVLSLVSALLADTSIFGAAKRAKLEALLAEKPPIGGMIVQLLALTPKFDWVNPEITDEHFPTVEPNLDGAQLEHYGKSMSSTAVLADFKSRGRRAATAAETLLYGIMNPEEQRKYWIVGLGQVWLYPGIGDYVVVLDEHDRERYASLYAFARDWYASYRFLSFPQ